MTATFPCLRCGRPTTVRDIQKSDGLCDSCGGAYDPAPAKTLDNLPPVPPSLWPEGRALGDEPDFEALWGETLRGIPLFEPVPDFATRFGRAVLAAERKLRESLGGVVPE